MPNLFLHPISRSAELAVLVGTQLYADPRHPVLWDALSRDTVSLSDLAEGEFDDDPYAALANDGIDAHTGADTVLDGSHDHALMMVGWALINAGDDE